MPTQQPTSCESEPHGTCPSCGEETAFEYIGVQHWPQEVAERLDVPQDQSLWQCRHCSTTLTELSLEFDNCV